MAYEALYRRYRPSRFQDAFFGQDHVVAALRNAIEGDRVGHAYLFSGPRGTGKTTSARILAKALNCTDLQGGEPCNECDSCLAFLAGGSYDLHELDAASNNGVDAIRDLIGKVALGSPGRTKVYILDEVHMLTPGAENALLKTLEEPPPHVVFVLCTTEPNKVVPTIRSRTQHLEFSLLSASQVGELIDHVTGDAGIEITAEDRQYVVRAGGGSARDTLSALDQVVAAGGAPQGGEHLESLFESLIDRDASLALAAIDGALQAGRDAASIGIALLHELRIVFLAAMRTDVSYLPEAERDRAIARAASMPPGRVTRAIEVIGTSLIEMRRAPDPRVDLEVAIMRLTRSDLDTDPAAMIERLEAIEGHLADGALSVTTPVAAALAQVSAVPQPAPAPAPAPAPQPAPVPQPAPAPAPVPQPQPAPAPVPQPQPAPAPVPQPAPAPAPAPPGGSRGAAIVRAALAEQGIAQAPARGSATEAPTEPAPGQAAPVSSGKTLADVRRERQAAANAAGESPEVDPAVAAATAARRERQAAAQSAGQASAPAPGATSAPPADAVAPAPQTDPVNGAPAPVAEASVGEPDAVLAPVAEASPSATAPAGSLPSLAELLSLWQPMLESMSGRVRSRFSAGHWVETTADCVNFGLPNPVHRERCEEIRAEVDDALGAQFGRPIPLALVVDMVEEEPDFFSAPPSGGAGATSDQDDEALEEDTIDVHGLVDATGDVPSAQDRVMTTFENSILLEDPQNNFPNP